MLIQLIRLRNFKAFKETEDIPVDCKNLLVYGNNGSGKSSLHFALHVFLQSSIKGDKYKKYFADPKDEQNGKESLLNIYGNPDDYLLELHLKKIDGATVVYQIKPEIDRDVHPHDHTDIVLSDFASDFISHRLLSTFYNFRNSEEANIWFMFERDILPYWIDEETGKNLNSWRYELGEELTALSLEKTRDPESGKVLDKFNKTSKEYLDFLLEVEKFNESFYKLYTALEPRLNEILGYFTDNEKLEVKLHYKTPWLPDPIRIFEWNLPELIIKVKSNGEPINRPHVFMNEARLTSLALSIRLAMFENKFKGTNRINDIEDGNESESSVNHPSAEIVDTGKEVLESTNTAGEPHEKVALETEVEPVPEEEILAPKEDFLKLLVLDDILISLDMSFRMKLIEYIKTSETFQDYQIMLLTHDKGLFEILQQTLAENEAKWKSLEFFETNTYPINNPHEYKNPLIVEKKDALTLAEEYLKGKQKDKNGKIIDIPKDYELSALYIRKKTEQLIKRFYDPEMDKIFRYRILKDLSNSIAGIRSEYVNQAHTKMENILSNGEMDERKIQKLIDLKFDDTGLSAEVKIENNKLVSFKKTVFALIKYYYSFQHNFQTQKKELELLSKELNLIRSRIMNKGAHDDDSPIFELELRGAIDKIKEFEKEVLKLK